MNQVVSTLTQNKYTKRLLQAGGVYLALEILAAICVLIFVASDINV